MGILSWVTKKLDSILEVKFVSSEDQTGKLLSTCHERFQAELDNLKKKIVELDENIATLKAEANKLDDLEKIKQSLQVIDMSEKVKAVLVELYIHYESSQKVTEKILKDLNRPLSILNN